MFHRHRVFLAGQGGRPEGEKGFAGGERGCIESHSGVGRVVRRQHAGGERGRVMTAGGLRSRGTGKGVPQNRLQVLPGNAAWAQQARCPVDKADNGGFHPDGRGAGVDEKGERGAEIGGDVIRRGSADPSGAIGTGRGDRSAGVLSYGWWARFASHPCNHLTVLPPHAA